MAREGNGHHSERTLCISTVYNGKIVMHSAKQIGAELSVDVNSCCTQDDGNAPM